MCRNNRYENIDLAVTLNNVGVTQHENGDHAVAMVLWKIALESARDLLHADGIKKPGVHLLPAYKRKYELVHSDTREDTTHGVSPLQLKSARPGHAPIRSTKRCHNQTSLFISNAMKIHTVPCQTLGGVDLETKHGYPDFYLSMAAILHNMGIVHYRRGDLITAAELFEKGLEFIPEDSEDWNQGKLCIFPILHNNLGHIYHIIGRKHDSLVAFEEASLRSSLLLSTEVLAAVQRQPQEHDSETDFVIKCTETIFFNLGLVSLLGNELELARESFREALAVGRNPSLLRHVIANLELIGQFYLWRKMFLEAANVYREAVKVQLKLETFGCTLPSTWFPSIICNIGYALYRAGEYREALVALSTTYQLLKNSPECNQHLFLKVQKLYTHLLLLCNPSPAA